MDTESIKENIYFFIQNYKIEELVLSGGEPTIQKDFLDILSYSKNAGIKMLYLHTNAIKFSDLQFLQTNSKYISKTLVGFHAHNKELYNRLSSINNFEKKIEGLKNLLNESIPTKTNTVIVNENIDYLPEIAQFLVNIGIEQSLLTFPFPIGKAKENFNIIVPRDFKIVRKYLRKTIDIFQNNGVDVKIQGFPLCYLKEFEKLQTKWREKIFVDLDHQFDNHLFLVSDVLKTNKNEVCRKCELSDRCEGFWFEYIKESEFEDLYTNREVPT
jgi:MoaA/NifB/PqqE/SkfB family radical SAM enzyme